MFCTTSCSTASGAMIPKCAGLPRLSLRIGYPCASSCLARCNTGPLMSYRTFCSLLACDTICPVPPRLEGSIVPEEGMPALGLPAGGLVPSPGLISHGPAGLIRRGLRQLGSGPVMMPRQQILQPDFHPLHGPPQPALAVLGLRELPRPRAVTPSCPGRSGPGDPDRADEEQGGHEQAGQAGPDLSLEQGDRRQQEQHDNHENEPDCRIPGTGQPQ